MVTFTKRNAYVKKKGIEFKDDSRTQQQYKDECDVCKQIERLSRTLDMTGQSLADYNNQGAMYGDFTQVPDFTTYQAIIIEAKEKFDALDPKVRERFQNDPTKLFDFIMDVNNKDEAIKLGLLAPEVSEIKDTISVPVDNDTPVNGSSASADTPI